MTEMIVRQNNSIITTYDEVERVAKAMAASGFFPDAKSISQAIVKIMAGSEIGFGPFASMQGVNIIKGRPSYNANMMASLVKASGKYNYRIAKLDDTICDLVFYEHGKEVGHSIFTIEDARKAGTSNLDKFPRNMLFARSMSNGVKWYTPDITNGNAIYTPEELGAEVDEDGNVINIDNTSVVIEAIEPDPVDQILEDAGPQALPEPMTIEKACTIENSEGTLYCELTPDKLSAMTIGISKALHKNGLAEDKRNAYLEKQEAIKVLLQANNEGSINLPMAS